MNILIPHHWLLEYLDTQATPEQIQDCLSLCGPSVERIYETQGEPVYDIENTTNRVDCMSILGIAREAATILPEFDIQASLISPLGKAGDFTESKDPLGIQITNDPALCHRILAVKLSNIKLSPSPEWLQNRLIQVEQRPLNNAIDITNYVMWEIGHPIHAFDYDRLVQKNIIVREAKAGEQFTTLDGKTYQTKGGEVVFDDGTGTIIDLPGIMGTANTVVTDQTQNVLLWIESVVPDKIRFASMQHGIRTQAAVLNEKGVDPELGLPAIHRAIQLFQELTQAQVSSEIVDIYPVKQPVLTTQLDYQQIRTYLGIEIPSDRVVRILTNLGCNVETSQTTKYHITPSSYRASDLQIPQDYIEEIARIYGYHNVPSTIMPTALPLNKPADSTFELETKLKHLLTGWGLQEVYTYSLVSHELATKSGYDISDHLQLSNPLSDEWMFLRRSHIPSHLKFLDDNRGAGDITIFEIANVYTPQKNNELPQEQLTLTITSNQTYDHLKGLLDALFKKLFISPQYQHSDTTSQIFQSHAVIFDTQLLSQHTTSNVGNLNPDLLLGEIGQAHASTPAYAFTVAIQSLARSAKSHPTYTPISKFSPIIQDFTFQFPSEIYVQPVITQLLSIPLITKVELASRYQTNLTFRLYFQSPDRQLTDIDIQPIREQITTTLNKEFSANLKISHFI